jgi:hypothetical protein
MYISCLGVGPVDGGCWGCRTGGFDIEALLDSLLKMVMRFEVHTSRRSYWIIGSTRRDKVSWNVRSEIFKEIEESTLNAGKETYTEVQGLTCFAVFRLN